MSGTNPSASTRGRCSRSTSAIPARNNGSHSTTSTPGSRCRSTVFSWAGIARTKLVSSKRPSFGPRSLARPGMVPSRSVSSKSASGGSTVTSAPSSANVLRNASPARSA
ncbi:hypothetical protein [Prauserella flavalba]|uniref:Uncharacterized protein n=1 Tax=Prauserella flavalba TaxID=1477506 RepID=A0A318LT74_9PSEU|nr:hypothetical protein [Prauserella flavalba]PXY36494.1 hypothetical protein BA062_13965 [Prauserella flavalba]